MISPSSINTVSVFSAIGNTPAVCLTQDLPYQHAAHILLLGCGDVRNVLFTTYSDTNPRRQHDITCCDIESAVLARNGILSSLLLDDVDELNYDSIWSFYYHLYIDDQALELLQAQSRKLRELATSIEPWHRSVYGRLLRFCDNGTFVSVREIWKSYDLSDLSQIEKELYKTRFEAGIQKSLPARTAYLAKRNAFKCLWSASPAGFLALKDLSNLHQYFWGDGAPAREGNPNPMFGPNDTSTLHYGLNPLLGYRLSTVYIPLDIKYPLKQKLPMNSGRYKVAQAAHFQFFEWAASFRVHAGNSLTLRFVAGDAIAVCNAILIGGEDYEGEVAPVTFDIIDTSNLADHVGFINVLVAASQLLKPTFLAILYTEVLLDMGRNRAEQLDNLLCCPSPTMSILPGLTPVEYWVNAAVSTANEEIYDNFITPSASRVQTDVEKGQMRSRIAWRLSMLLHT
ncbi:hypothetical protein BJ875DRAFT_498233 [Amylocarpus encephaloides]|uniref:DUF4470 domain-containing protein n=1 Tax=Amylocarpus encephaloides TaxID=45428 RepID=A0A9P8C414_9HELO|nr:hypothetical protein BJ875DRAFT_498233 [Amylocarpus encephaloides]